ncbi:VOC family protein [Actinomadura sp. 3N407]|uniref:VOC family protein n=1 Tax=Actinomadura sp. 3N407 TaxID=3457423 RepID=UPI003FCE80DA
MTQVTSNAPEGTPTWLDIGVPDIDRARTFYGTLLGWEFQDAGPEAGHYNQCSLRGEPVAGMMENPADQPDVYWWGVYFAADDCDGVVERATGAGADVVAPAMDVMGLGRMAILTHPHGGQFGLWEGHAHPGSRIVNEPGSFVWNELFTPDSGPACEFFRAVFGYELEPIPEGDMDYTVLRRPDGRYVGGVQGGSGIVLGGGDAPVPSWTTYFAVDDADAAVRAVRDGGGTVDAEPVDSPYGRFAAVRDPFGVPFMVMKPAPDAGT